jgi:RNA polymerase sigma-70 factor (ECF subfamily)
MTDLRDPLQFNDAYRRLQPLALSAANRVLRDEAAAEDVVQDVFMHLWLKPASYNPERGSLASYITMLSRSRALDRWRTRQAREAAVDRSADEARVHSTETEDAAEPVIRRERSTKLLGALGELPDEQKEAVLLAYGRGLTAQEISKAVNIPLGTAKSRVRLGLRRARASLDNLELAA